jgi:hypothetical protein
MGKRLLTNNKCPLCGDYVQEIPDGILKKHPHEDNVEMVVTKRGLKQYIHTNCWNEMIATKQPYYGRMYV